MTNAFLCSARMFRHSNKMNIRENVSQPFVLADVEGRTVSSARVIWSNSFIQSLILKVMTWAIPCLRQLFGILSFEWRDKSLASSFASYTGNNIKSANSCDTLYVVSNIPIYKCCEQTKRNGVDCPCGKKPREVDQRCLNFQIVVYQMH